MRKVALIQTFVLVKICTHVTCVLRIRLTGQLARNVRACRLGGSAHLAVIVLGNQETASMLTPEAFSNTFMMVAGPRYILSHYPNECW